MSGRIALGATGLASLAVPLVAGPYLIEILLLVFFYAYLGQCWNILGGYAGQLSLGHALFFGVGAYTSAILDMRYGLSPWIGMFVGGGLAALLSLFIGFLGFRFGLRGFYFVLLTVAFAEVGRLVALHLPILGGYQGLFLPGTGGGWHFQFRGKIPYYYVALAFMVAGSAVVWVVERSKLGRYLTAIREDEEAAESVGVDAFRYKLMAYALSAGLTAFGGTFYAFFFYYLHPSVAFNIGLSVDILLRPIVGGSGTLLGPILGSFILSPLAELARTYFVKGGLPGLHLIVYGVLLILVVLFLPQGAAPHLTRAWHRVTKGRGSGA